MSYLTKVMTSFSVHPNKNTVLGKYKSQAPVTFSESLNNFGSKPKSVSNDINTNRSHDITELKKRLFIRDQESTSNNSQALNILFSPRISQSFKDKMSKVFFESMTNGQKDDLIKKNSDIKHYFKNTDRLNNKNKEISSKKDELFSMLLNKENFEEYNRKKLLNSCSRDPTSLSDVNGKEDKSLQKIKLFQKDINKIFMNRSRNPRNKMPPGGGYSQILNGLLKNKKNQTGGFLKHESTIEEFENFKKGL